MRALYNPLNYDLLKNNEKTQILFLIEGNIVMIVLFHSFGVLKQIVVQGL